METSVVKSTLLAIVATLAIAFATSARADTKTDGPFEVLSVSCINESKNQRVCGVQLNGTIGPERCASGFAFWHLNELNKTLLDIALASSLEEKEVFVVFDDKNCIDNTQGVLRPKVVGLQMTR